jgi:hypothetical protein
MVSMVLRYLKSILIAFDQLCNAFLGGSPDETFSARAYRLRDDGWWVVYKTINCLFFWQEDHCKGSYISEVLRKHLPTEYKTRGPHEL